MQFNVTIADDRQLLSAGQAAQLEQTTLAAGARWASVLAPSAASFEVRIVVTADFPRASASAVANQLIETRADGIQSFLVGTLYEASTGIDPNGAQPDIEIRIHPDYLDQLYVGPGPIPADKRALISTLAHELGHAFGFIGWTDWNTYQKPNHQSGFDQQIAIIDGKPYFIGKNAVATFGGPVPLTPGGVFHVGNPDHDEDLTDDLMNGITAKPGPDSGITALDLAMISDIGGATVLNDTIRGTNRTERFNAGRGDDIIIGGGGGDYIDGAEGFDIAQFQFAAARYDVSQTSSGWSITDRQTGQADSLINIEALRFQDGLKLLAPTLPDAYLAPAAGILRLSPGDTRSLSALTTLIEAAASAPTALSAILALATSTTSVATLSYQFFTDRTPSSGGLDYLISPAGANANNLNSPYYQNFNLENRYINFAINLGRDGDGKAWFAQEYGSLTLSAATKKAYGEIFGRDPSDSKVAALLDGRVAYFAAFSGDTQDGIGTKAAMVGWLLATAAKESLGQYAHANNAYLATLADGQGDYAVDLVGQFGKPEFDYIG